MIKFKYALFFDFHTLVTIPDVGERFDVEAFADQIASCGVDFLTFHARCNQGNAYYDTKIGQRHPSLHYDLVKRLCNACAARNIRLSLYLNGHLSEEETLAHPDWADVPFAPRPRKESPFFHQVCYNSPFREHLRDMALELIRGPYRFYGFFFDCLGVSDCVCPRCVAEMKQNKLDWNNLDDVLKFSAFSADRMCRFLNDAIRKEKPDTLLFFNGRPFEEVAGMESHFECECLPTAGWGYDCLPSFAHYLRTIADGRCILNMTGRFNNWGDFGGLRSEESLEFDLLYGAAHGMRPDIGGHCHPRGDLDRPVFDRIRSIFNHMRRYDEWVLDAVNECDVALVYPRTPLRYIPEGPSTRAAVRMLDELKVQFDYVSEAASWDKYRLLIFPDDVSFNLEIVQRVQAHLSRGGRILATAKSGLDPNGKAFSCPEWPAFYIGPTKHDPLYFQPSEIYAEGLPDMPLSVYASGTSVRAAEGTKTEMFCVKPYMNYGWDGLHGNRYVPPQSSTDEPFLLEKNGIVYIAGELFAGYGHRGARQLKDLLANVLKHLDPEPKLRTSGLPSFARAVVQQKGDCEIVHLLAYCPEKRCDSIVVEDRVDVRTARVSLRLDGKKISRAFCAPDGPALSFEENDGYCQVDVPPFSGYCLLVFEDA